MAESLLEVSARDVANRFGYYTDEAMQRPVGIQRHGRTRVVMLSLKEYERLTRRAKEGSGREVIRTEDLDDEWIEALRNAEPGERSREAERRLADPGPAPDREAVLARLRANEAELRAGGIRSLSLFGSVARGDAGSGSDVDLAAELDHGRGMDLLDVAEINLRLSELLGTKVDLVSEPARKPAFQARIDRDRVRAF